MANSFTQVPLADIHSFLTEKRFTPDRVGDERVYTRTGRNSSLRIVVYSSVQEGETAARDCGTDAIRVVLLGKSRTEERCFYKARRINRTGTVQEILDRVLNRILEAAEASKNYHGPCTKCGCPLYADSGRCTNTICRKDHG